MSFKKLLPFVLVILSAGANAQVKNLYSYQDLSHFYYEKQKDSLKKAWACPDAFKKKEAQRQYKELWDRRTDAVTGAIAGNDYVHEQEVYGYIEAILRQITDANKDMVPVKPLLLIDRSPAINAYSTGGNGHSFDTPVIVSPTSRGENARLPAPGLLHNSMHHLA